MSLSSRGAAAGSPWRVLGIDTSLRSTGEATPWYFNRKAHHAWLYCAGVISPEKTFHRH